MKQTVQESGTSGAVYGLGFIGAVIYFISTAGGFCGELKINDE